MGEKGKEKFSNLIFLFYFLYIFDTIIDILQMK